MDSFRQTAKSVIFTFLASYDLKIAEILAKSPGTLKNSLKLITSTAVALAVQNNFSYQVAQAFTLNLCTSDALISCVDSSLIPTLSILPSLPLSFNSLAYLGVVQAGQEWSNIFTDNVSVNIKIEFKDYNNFLAQTTENRVIYTYNQFYEKLRADRTFGDNADWDAFSSLQDGSSSSSTFKMLLNLTKDNPNGSGSLTPYLDNNGKANNQLIQMTRANAKALGLLTTSSNDNPYDAIDATIQIDSNPGLTWDFDPTSIDSDKLDFVGVARHEIGHALGFESGVDILDWYGSKYNSTDYTSVTPLDLFRFTSQSQNIAPGIFDWTARKNIDSYFSIDGGVTKLASFSTGVKNGNGKQASHWLNSSTGIMGATTSKGQKLPSISNLDIKALNVIGWNLKQGLGSQITLVPEPSEKLGLMAVGLGFLLTLKNRLRAKNRH